jgi:hypothetical protein
LCFCIDLVFLLCEFLKGFGILNRMCILCGFKSRASRGNGASIDMLLTLGVLWGRCWGCGGVATNILLQLDLQQHSGSVAVRLVRRVFYNGYLDRFYICSISLIL